MNTRTRSRAAYPLQGLGALVTGGSRGIGRAVAVRLAEDGAAVVLTYANRREDAAQAVAGIHATGGWARALPLDVAEPDQFPGFFRRADDAFADAGVRGPDIVVANAGIASHSPIGDLSCAEWDRVMNVNARGYLLTVQHAGPRIPDDGRVIALSTIGTAWPSPGEAGYAASKAAVEQISRVASRELGHRGITVNTVSPGPTDTDLLRFGASPEDLAGAAELTALGRLGRPADIAGTVALLASPDSAWVTGQNIRADGGLT